MKDGVPREKLHMSNLFDMFAGTSTGSMISAALSLPMDDDKTQPKYWARDTVNIYKLEAPVIFTKNGVDFYREILCYTIFIIVFSSLFFFIGTRKFNNKKTHVSHC